MVTPKSTSILNFPIYEQAAEWLVELREGEVDAVLRERLDAWFRASPEHIRAYLELSSIWEDGADPDLDHAHSTDELIAHARERSNIVPLSASFVKATPESSSWRSELALVPAAKKQGSAHRTFGTARNARVTARRSFWAAAVVVACGVGGVSLYLYSRLNSTFATGIGEERFVKLEDGSTLELNSRSRVRIRFSVSQRDVDLIEGQALFRVAKDPARPFVVHSDSTRVRAVGTQFDVYRKASGTTVTVVEGRVAVLSPLLEQAERESSPSGDERGSKPSPSGRSPTRPQSLSVQREDLSQRAGTVVGKDSVLAETGKAIFLSAGEQVTVTPREVVRPTRTDPAVATAWIQHELIFDSTSLNEVAQEFNRYNTRQLVISDAALRELQITGVFSSADPSSLMKFLRAQRDIAVLETDEDIRISKK